MSQDSEPIVEEKSESRAPRTAEVPPAGEPSEERHEDNRRVISKLVGGIQGEAGKVFRNLLDRNPVSGESAEHLLDLLIRALNRREFLERLLRSEFMKNVRDMQSEITEAIGFASAADVKVLKDQLDEVLLRMDKLQKTLDEIVVEVEEP